MSTILATGGLGFIGSHTTVSLLERGFDVLVIDSLVNSKLSTLNKIKEILHKRPFPENKNLYPGDYIKEIARDISYSSSAKRKAGREVIRTIENMTGRISLIKKAKNY